MLFQMVTIQSSYSYWLEIEHQTNFPSVNRLTLNVLKITLMAITITVYCFYELE